MDDTRTLLLDPVGVWLNYPTRLPDAPRQEAPGSDMSPEPAVEAAVHGTKPKRRFSVS